MWSNIFKFRVHYRAAGWALRALELGWNRLPAMFICFNDPAEKMATHGHARLVHKSKLWAHRAFVFRIFVLWNLTKAAPVPGQSTINAFGLFYSIDLQYRICFWSLSFALTAFLLLWYAQGFVTPKVHSWMKFLCISGFGVFYGISYSCREVALWPKGSFPVTKMNASVLNL